MRELGLAVSLQKLVGGALLSKTKRVKETDWSKNTRDSINGEDLRESSCRYVTKLVK
jgi:hypothetical protein